VVGSPGQFALPEPRCQENPYRQIRIFIEKSERYDLDGLSGLDKPSDQEKATYSAARPLLSSPPLAT
jgi:hypothetical protein